MTFVGKFDCKDLDLIKTVCAVSHFVPYTQKRIEELKDEVIYLKDINVSYKLVFNEDNKLEKIIFRKVKRKFNA